MTATFAAYPAVTALIPLRGRSALLMPRLVRTRHNRGVNSFSILETQTPAVADPETLQLQGWVSRMAQGDAQAMEQLYDASCKRVYALVRRFIADDTSAHDVTQEVYLQAWQHAARFDGERGSVMAWLLNLARSRALDAWRKAASSPVLINSEAADEAASQWLSTAQPSDFLEAADRQAVLYEALQDLPAVARQMLSLAFFHDMSHSEISAHLQTPLGTVKSTVRRALINLRAHLQQRGLQQAHLAALEIEDTP
jgi:RNA polymerase sigma factor (sigma-70 family)